MRGFIKWLCAFALLLIVGNVNAVIKEFEFDQKLTTLEELDGQNFAIVNETDGKAFYGTTNQNLGYDLYESAFVETNTAISFRLVAAQGDDVSGKFYLQSVKADGTDYSIWGGGYLNSQPATGGCCFIMGLAGQNGQDGLNLAVWDIEVQDGGFALKNLGTGLYLMSNDAAKYDEPTYFSFYTLKEKESVDPLAAQKTDLSDAIAKGKIVPAIAYTEASFAAVAAAVTTGEDALADVASTAESLTVTTTAINNAIAALELKEGFSNLTSEMFMTWDSATEPTAGNPTGCVYELFNPSGMPFGDPNVGYLNFVNLQGYDMLYITYSDGTPRIMMNRDVNEGQWDADEAESHLIDNTRGGWSAKYFTNEDGIVTVDLKQIIADKGFATLNAIKGANWANVTVTGLFLYNAPASVDPDPVESIYIETDLTAQFPVDYQGWTGATSFVGWAAPAVITNDGRETAACEKYEGTCANTGDVFTRTLTGLTNGTYRIELYGAAAYTSGRGFDSELVEGDETAVYLYAETAAGIVKQYIPAHVADNFNGTGIATAVLDNVVITDGTVKLGMYKEMPYTNWHVIQIKGVTAKVDAIELHAAALEAAQAALTSEEYLVVTGEERTTLETAVTNNTFITEQTAEAYEAAVEALNETTTAFTGAKSAYESLANLKMVNYAYADRFPYATEDKKAAAAAAQEAEATSAADAMAMTENLYIACRQLAESHALLEGVNNAVNITDRIVNPNAEEDIISPWTLVNGEDSYGYMQILSNEPLIDGESKTYRYFDGGDWEASAWDVALKQDIILPAGKYMLTVSARASSEVQLTVFAGEEEGGIPSIGATEGLFGLGWNDASIEFEVNEEGEVTIGVHGIAEGIHNWMSFTRFRLMQFPADVDESLAAAKVDLETAITAAKAIDTEGKNGAEALAIAIADAENALYADEATVETLAAAKEALVQSISEFNMANLEVEPLFADGTYYIYNEGVGKYLGAGASWGTHAIVDNTGLDYYITFNMGKYTLDSRVSNGYDSQYLNGEWNDGPAFGWTIEDKGNGYYMISDGNQFLAAQEDGLVVMTDAPTSSCLWTLVTQEQRLAELANATPENPIDATFLIQGANFSRNDQRNYAWSMDASSQNLSGGNNVNNCAESWHSTFTLTQTLYNAPVGKYLVSAQGFYRQDGEIEEVPVFYANTSTAEFPVNTGTENSMSDASESFSAGLYNIEPFVVNVSEAGALTIGARGTALSQWVIFDNFRLTYLSSEVAIDDIAANYAQVLADAVAALESEHYAMVTGLERTSLAETIEAYSSVANDQDAYTVAINNLSYATNYFTNAKDAYESLIKAKEQLAISVDNYPYADPWYKEEVVKYAELTAQMADEAYDLASAITSYARRIAESHALLEGVERSSDMTEFIMNPNAYDDRNYWELVYDGSGYIVIRSNEPLTDADYRIYPYFDGGYWESDYWNVALQQEIYLPAGRYQLTVSSRASSDVAFTLYAGDESVAMPTIGAEGGLFGNGWNDTSLEFEVPEEGPVTIGVRGESNVIYNWMSFTRFRLAKFPNAADFNNLYIAEDTNLSRGNAILPISLQNEDEIVGLQFDVVLPYDMNLTEIESGFRSGSHGVSFNQMNNNTFRVVMASMDNEVIEGYDGVLMNLGLEIPAYLSAGWYDVILRNVVMTTSSLQTIKCADQSFGVKITGRMGDVNSDNVIDVTDVVMIIDNILEHYDADFNASMADVNYDGYIDVTDVVNVIDVILGKIELSRGAEPIDRSAYTAFQMDLTIPAGYVLESVSLTDIAKDSHSLTYTMLPDGRCRVVVCSMNNEALPGAWNEVIRLNLRGNGDAQVNIDRAVFVTIDGERHELMMNPTSIAELSTLNSQISTRYDLQGRKVEKNAKGILIDNGKKTVRK